MRQGTAADKFSIVLDGEVAVEREAGGASRRIAALRRGKFFGEMGLLGDTPRTATVRAIGRTTVLALGREAFRALSAESLDGAADLDRIIQGRLGGQVAAPGSRP